METLLFEPLGHDFVRRALLELALLAAVFGPLGVWVLLLRQAYAAESIAHAVLPGLVIASLAGFPLVLGAAGGMFAGAFLIALAARDPRLGSDTAVAAVITAFVGAGALLALSPDVPARLRELLFGDLIGVAGADLALAAGVVLLGLAALAALHRPLALTAFDRTAAEALGTRPALAELGLLAVLALSVVAAVEAIGSLLVVALLIGPSAAALRLSRRLQPAMAVAACLGLAAGVAGLWASYHLELAAGASVALASVLVFIASLGIARP